jgi:hypothetical protein
MVAVAVRLQVHHQEQHEQVVQAVLVVAVQEAQQITVHRQQAQQEA